MAMIGLDLKDWEIYCEPAHASVYTSPDSPDHARIMALQIRMGEHMMKSIYEIRESHRPGLINELVTCEINGQRPDDLEGLGVIMLLIGGGFDTTTALTPPSLHPLSPHPPDRHPLPLHP